MNNLTAGYPAPNEFDDIDGRGIVKGLKGNHSDIRLLEITFEFSDIRMTPRDHHDLHDRSISHSRKTKQTKKKF